MFEYARGYELERPDPEELKLSGSEELPEGWRRLGRSTTARWPATGADTLTP